MKRRSGLRRDTDKARAFVQRGRGALRSGPRAEEAPAPSLPHTGGEGMRSVEFRRAAALGAPAPAQPKQDAPRLAKPRAPGTSRRSWAHQAKQLRCAMCGTRVGLQGHHIIPLQRLKDAGVDPLLWYDQRNMLPLCNEPSDRRCHQRHELHVRRVPREVVDLWAPQAREFARQVGMEAQLDALYTPGA